MYNQQSRVSHLGLGGVCVAGLLLFVGDVAEHVVVVGVVHPLLLHLLLVLVYRPPETTSLYIGTGSGASVPPPLW